MDSDLNAALTTGRDGRRSALVFTLPSYSPSGASGEEDGRRQTWAASTNSSASSASGSHFDRSLPLVLDNLPPLPEVCPPPPVSSHTPIEHIHQHVPCKSPSALNGHLNISVDL